MFAAAQGDEAMVRRLLKAGANKKLKSVDGDDATSLAHTNKHASVAQILGGS
jgi:ankyrin repeat protein